MVEKSNSNNIKNNNNMFRNIVTYNSIIATFGKISELMIMISRMKSQGIRANEVTYNSIIAPLSKQNYNEEVMKVFERMTYQDFFPDLMNFVHANIPRLSTL